jgi:hypothetical protein
MGSPVMFPHANKTAMRAVMPAVGEWLCVKGNLFALLRFEK